MTRKTNGDFPSLRESKRSLRDPFERNDGYRLRSPNRLDPFYSGYSDEDEVSDDFFDRAEQESDSESDFQNEHDFHFKRDLHAVCPQRRSSRLETRNASTQIVMTKSPSASLFFRNATLAVSFVVITLIAVYWDKLPPLTSLTAQAKTFLRHDDKSKTEFVVDHQTQEGEIDRSATDEIAGESFLGVSGDDSVSGEVFEENGRIQALDHPNQNSSEREAEDLAKIQTLLHHGEADSEKTVSGIPTSSGERGMMVGRRREPTLVPTSDAVLATKSGLSDGHSLEVENGATPTQKFISETEPVPPETARILESQGVKNGKLQRWGNGGRFWRYSCEAEPMAVGAGFSRYFEAVGPSSEEVIETVILKVRQWQQEQRL